MRYIFVFFLLSFHTAQAAQLIDHIMAIVGDEIITLSDFKNYQKKIRKNEPIDEILFLGKNPKTVMKNKEKLLNILIDERILEAEVKSQKLEATLETVEKEIRRIAKNYNLTRKQLIQEIKKDGQSFSDYQHFIKTRLERQRLIEQAITSKIHISKEEILQYYLKQNPKAKEQVYEYTLAHIFFSSSKKNKSTKAIDRAIKVLEKLQRGENFESLVKKYSDKAKSNPKGILGTAKANEFNSSISKAVSGLKEGEYSKVIPMPGGYSILKIVKKVATSTTAFTRATPKIQSLLTQQAFEKQFTQWLSEKRKAIFVKVNL